MQRIPVVLSFFMLSICGRAQMNDSLLVQLLFQNHDSTVQQVLRNAKEHRLQIIYTQINRNANNKPSFRNFYYNADTGIYFNPASTVKLPLALLALEKLNNMHNSRVNKNSYLQYDSAWEKQVEEYSDSTASSGLPTIAQFIRKAFLVSDNDAYNRLYEFVGQQQINRRLHEKGYDDIRITRQFMSFTPEQNRHTNPIRIITKDGQLIHQQPMAFNTDSFHFNYSNSYHVGNAYINRNDSLIHEPMDFTTHNNLPLKDLQQLLQSVLFPASVPHRKRFLLTRDDEQFLYQYLSQYPSETNFPKYDTSVFYNSYVKFFFRAGSHNMPSNVRVFNKVGWAYGFLTDVSYVVDFEHKVEFMLAATLYTNSDGVLNDDKYDYDQVGWPFLYQLGQTIYRYELNRKRNHLPDLNRFKISYEKRITDNRPLIKEVDN